MIQQPIYIFDLHNTLYDEVIEYSLSLQAAVDCFLNAAMNAGITLDRAALYQQLSHAHAALGSDWDEDVWDKLAVLAPLRPLQDLKEKAIRARHKASQYHTKNLTFSASMNAIRHLKEKGHTLYIATEGTQNAAAQAIEWLNLDGTIQCVFSWPFTKTYDNPLTKTLLENFPEDPLLKGHSLKKPHPLILGQVFLEHAKTYHDVPSSVTLDEVFDCTLKNTLDEHTLCKTVALNANIDHPQVQSTLSAIQTTLQIKPGPYKKCLQSIQSHCFYIGDSFFKDGLLAKNANVKFIHAAYGQYISPENETIYQHCKALLLQTTGWDPYLMKLTQAASTQPELTQCISPYFICHHSFQEFIDFLANGSDA